MYLERLPIGLQVQTGWTGSVTATIGGTTVTVDPSAFNGGHNSAKSVLDRLARDGLATFGGTWEAWVEASSAKAKVQHSATFTLAATGNTQTRLAISASASAAEHTGSQLTAGTYVDFDDGLEYQGHDRATSRGPSTASLAQSGFTGGGIGGAWSSVSVNMRVFCRQFATAWNIMEAVMSSSPFRFDLGYGTRTLGRFRVESASMAKRGKSPALQAVTITARSEHIDN